jgi:YVTN family beta-propeller protein
MAPGQPDERAEGLIEGILQRGEQTAAPFGNRSELLTFLFADIRGYTSFTQRRGDEAAAKLTAKFAMIVRELVAEFSGTVFELRGDEALCVFGSPRQALRLAVALQGRFVEETVADAELPMPVGIGVDAGEAVHGSDGYRGGALNLAARLCGQAKAGQVLATPEVTHLARTIDGIRYAVLDRVAVKGLTEPVRPVRVFPEGEDPAQQMAALLSASAPRPTPVRWLPGRLAAHPRSVVAALAAAAVAAAGLVVALVHDSGGQKLTGPAENSLGVIDPGTGRLVGQVPIDDGPTAVAAGFGSIWTTNIDDNSVTRIDAKSLQVKDTIEVGTAPSAIAAGRDSLWGTNSGEGTVSRIDPTTDRARTIRVGVAPSGVVVAQGSVWVTNAADGTVSRIDPSQNTEVQRIAVDSGPSGIGAGRDIWVANSASNTVTRIDGQHPAVTQRIHVGDGPRGIAVVGNTVWVSYNGGDEVAGIATTATTVSDLVTVGQRPDQITATGGHVWVTLQGSGAIVEIHPATNRIIRTVQLGPIPGGIAVAQGKLWVTTTSDPTLHRGGTLHLVGQVRSIDPYYTDGLDGASLLAGSYDGLVAFRHVSGADGLTIVPDLAAAIPEPVDGDRTYTFTLRKGIRFSTGKPVTVVDVQRGIERTAAAESSRALRQMLVGASRCTTDRCHISGITVDDATRTVTIRLVRPSGNLLDLLTSCLAMPPGTPLAEGPSRPIAATGPYRIARYVANKEIVLTRNPYFHEWSAAAQPDGFPERIEYRILPAGVSTTAIDEVAAGDADWTDALESDNLNASSLEDLRTRFGSRLRVTPTQIMYGVFLNTRIPPFNEPRARQALAYAIDRKAVADDWFQPANLTCQFTPPDYPGYRPYCPYTSRPDSDTWLGADLAEAQKLLKGLHPERTTVTVWAPPWAKKAIGHVVDALHELRYRVRFDVWPNSSFDYFDYVFDSRNRVQAGFMGWLTYDASASNTFSLYRCDAFVPAGAVDDQNPAEFCDPSLDRLMRRAEAVQATSLADADDLWAEVEQRLVRAAPWVPLVNPLSVDVLSTQVHNFKRTPTLGVLFDQMWVR